MTPRPEVVELLVSFDLAASDPVRGHFVHDDGRPFTNTEAALVTSVKADDMREVHRRTEGQPDHDERLQKIMALWREWQIRDAEMGYPLMED